MDKLDIFELPNGAKIQTTIGEMCKLYFKGMRDHDLQIQAGDNWDLIEKLENMPVIIEGDVI